MNIANLIISITNKVRDIKDNVLAAYDVISNKGGEMPNEKSVENLPTTISRLQVKKPEVPINSVIFIDFDGTVLYSYSVKEYAQLTELPAPPTHWEHLNFIGWTHTLEETQNSREQIIGARYELKEPDKMYFIVQVTNNECSILNNASNNCYIDWGDGSTDLYKGGGKVITHIYEENKEYEICIYGEVLPSVSYFTTSCKITYNYNDAKLLIQNSYYPYNPEAVGYPNYVSKVIYRLGETLGTFANFTGLEWVVVTDKLTSTSINIGSSLSLKGCNFNDNITSIASRQNLNCFQLCRIPSNATFTMPTLIESGIKELYIPNQITTLGMTNMPNRAKVIHIMRSVVKDGDITVMPFNYFANNNNIAQKFYVPADSVEAYKTATNWSVIADKIFSEEDSL